MYFSLISFSLYIRVILHTNTTLHILIRFFCKHAVTTSSHYFRE